MQVFPGYCEDDLLRYSATAFHNLDDERSGALARACCARGITRLDLQPVEFGTDLTLVQGNNRIKVGDLGARGRGQSKSPDQNSPGRNKLDIPDSLMIGINGQVAGLIHFRRSANLEATSTLRRFRSKRNLRIGIISEQPQPGPTLLGADFQIGGLAPDARIRLLKDCRRRGIKVAYVGNGRIDPRTVAEAHVAISLFESGTDYRDNDPAPIGLLQPRITKLGELWDIANIHRRRLRVAHGYALIPNLACVAGAFIWGFTSLAVVMVTNIGTYCVYSRTSASIRSLEHQIAESLGMRHSTARKTITQSHSQQHDGG